MSLKILSICAALSVTASLAGAQQRDLPAELGIDAGLSVGFDSPRVTTIQLPVPAVRLGFYLNDRVSVEPKVGVESIHDNSGAATAFTAQVGALFHFDNSPIGRGAYARPFAGILGERVSGSSETRTVIGAGLGIKEPFAERFASRLEVNYSHVSGVRTLPASNAIGILFGISVFSR